MRETNPTSDVPQEAKGGQPPLLAAKAPVLRATDAVGIDALFAPKGPVAAFIHGDSRAVKLPEASIDCIITSPPYWAQRRYADDSGIGQEERPEYYVESLASVFARLRPALKPTGSLWLNLGDSYDRKQLCGIPWRVALRLQADGWVLRNAVVWDKVKGNPDNARDKLRNTYEMMFHFVRQTEYHYDVDAIRNEPGQPTDRNGKIATATGVTGQKYERQIREATALTETERRAALAALKNALDRVRTGDLPDFRMVIRGYQRSTHSEEREFSGRAAELERKGFYILPYHKNGTKPGDVWRITPEDEWRTDKHAAVFPKELCRTPILATCPPGGVVLDPFAGTGTAILAAVELGRRGVGIDTSPTYLKTATDRLQRAKAPLPFLVPVARPTNGSGNGRHR